MTQTQETKPDQSEVVKIAGSQSPTHVLRSGSEAYSRIIRDLAEARLRNKNGSPQESFGKTHAVEEIAGDKVDEFFEGTQFIIEEIPDPGNNYGATNEKIYALKAADTIRATDQAKTFFQEKGEPWVLGSKEAVENFMFGELRDRARDAREYEKMLQRRAAAASSEAAVPAKMETARQEIAGGPEARPLPGTEQKSERPVLDSMPDSFKKDYGDHAETVWKAEQGFKNGRLVMPHEKPKGLLGFGAGAKAAKRLNQIATEHYKIYGSGL